MDYSLPGSSVHGIPWSRKWQEYWSGFQSFLQGTFLTQELNLGLLHCRQILYHLSHQEAQAALYWSLLKGLGISLQLDIKLWEDKKISYLPSP